MSLKDWVRGTKIHAGPTWVRSRSTSSSSGVTSLLASVSMAKESTSGSRSLQAVASVEGEAGGRPNSRKEALVVECSWGSYPEATVSWPQE